MEVGLLEPAKARIFVIDVKIEGQKYEIGGEEF
jgi:hypothetical protein